MKKVLSFMLVLAMSLSLMSNSFAASPTVVKKNNNIESVTVETPSEGNVQVTLKFASNKTSGNYSVFIVSETHVDNWMCAGTGKMPDGVDAYENGTFTVVGIKDEDRVKTGYYGSAHVKEITGKTAVVSATVPAVVTQDDTAGISSADGYQSGNGVNIKVFVKTNDTAWGEYTFILPSTGLIPGDEKQETIISADDKTVTYNKTGQDIDKVTINGSRDGLVTEYKLSSADDSAYTTAKPINAGIYTVRIKVDENDIYKAAEKKVTLTINKADPTVNVTSPADGTSITYGTKLDDIDVTGTVTGAGGETVTGNLDWTNVNDTVTTEGDKEWTFVPGSGFADNYNTVKGNINLAIAPKVTPVIVGFTDAEYDGSDRKPAVVVKNGDSVIPETEYSVEWQNSKGEVVTELKDADTYTAKVTMLNQNVYNNPADATFVISKKPLTFVLPEISKVYDGTDAIEAEDITAIEATALTGKVGSADVKLSVGTVKYSSANAAGDIALSGEFALTGNDAKNYTLTQPTMPKGEITQAELINQPIIQLTTDADADHTADIGDILTADISGMNPDLTSADVEIKWYIAGTEAPVGTGADYTVTEDDIGKKIIVKVTAKTSGNYTGEKASIPYAVGKKELTGKPTIEGAAVVGSVLEAKIGTVAATENDVTWQWYRDGVAIENAAGKTYTILPADLGKNITVEAVAKEKSDYTGTSERSDALEIHATKPEKPVNLKASGNGKLNFTWQPPANDGGSPITKYIVQISDREPVEITSLNNPEYTFTGLKNGKKYTITVKAVNDIGESDAASITAEPSSGGGGGGGGIGGGGGGAIASTCRITFETNGGSTIDPVNVKMNDALAKPKNPTKQGCSFAGWYTDQSLTALYDFAQKVTKSFTLYAKWNEGTGSGHRPGILTDEHDAYIIGREDGYVYPEANITRAEVATIFFRLLTDEVRAANYSAANGFGDVESGDWFNNAVSTLSKLEIVKGYSDEVFAPDNNITRAEFAAIVARFSDAEYNGEDMFTDISGHWAQDYINRAASVGWIIGENGLFRPDDHITRAEVMTLVNRVLERQPESAEDLSSDMVKFYDNADENAWYYLAIQEAVNGHDYEMKSDGVHEKWTNLRAPRDWSSLEK